MGVEKVVTQSEFLQKLGIIQAYSVWLKTKNINIYQELNVKQYLSNNSINPRLNFIYAILLYITLCCGLL